MADDPPESAIYMCEIVRCVRCGRITESENPDDSCLGPWAVFTLDRFEDSECGVIEPEEG